MIGNGQGVGGTIKYCGGDFFVSLALGGITEVCDTCIGHDIFESELVVENSQIGESALAGKVGKIGQLVILHAQINKCRDAAYFCRNGTTQLVYA